LQQSYRILSINPKANVTEIGIFENESCLLDKTIHHAHGENVTLAAQSTARKKDILEALFTEGFNISKFAAVVARGGLLRPIAGGTYEVNEAMVKDLQQGYNGTHPSNLGGLIAFDCKQMLGIPAYIVDPVVVDEFADVARFSGMPEIERKSIFHALSQKAAARKTAESLKIAYEKANFIVLHLGGGITIGAHYKGRVIDVNNGLHGDGPLAPERAGTVPSGDLIALCYSGAYSEAEMIQKVSGQGGLAAYLGTNSPEAVEELVKAGDHQASQVYEAMIYQAAKEIGAMSTVLKGDVQAIVLTGRLSQFFSQQLTNRVAWIADVFTFPGENVLESLASGALRVLQGKEQVKTYQIGNKEGAHDERI